MKYLGRLNDAKAIKAFATKHTPANYAKMEKAEGEGAEPKKVPPMPKQGDYPEIKDFSAAMRVWREKNRTAKDAAGAVANRCK